MERVEGDIISGALKESKVIAVVGISDKPERAGFYVPKYLSQFYRITPVNPSHDLWQGERSYGTLLDIPADISVDLVNIFRRSDQVSGVVDQCIERRVKFIWMQSGISNAVSAARAEKSGIRVVMDRCLMVEHRLWIGNEGRS